MAETLCRLVPSIELVRLVSSGTEATMSALRLARGFTGRSKIVKFEGCYHGHGDSLLVKAGSGALTFGTPSSAGVPPRDRQRDDRRCRTTTWPPSRPRSARKARDIACIIVEPIVGNMNLIMPRDGLPARACARCATRMARVLIFDEVMTGFRVHPRRRAGLVRHHAGPDDARQGDRRRHAGRRVRRPARRSWRKSRRSAPSTRRARFRAIRSPSRRDSRRSRRSRRPGSTSGLSSARARSPTASSQSARRAGVPFVAQSVGRHVRTLLRRVDPGHLRRGDGMRQGTLQPLLPRDARRRRLLRAVGVRGGIRRAPRIRPTTSRRPLPLPRPRSCGAANAVVTDATAGRRGNRATCGDGPWMHI